MSILWDLTLLGMGLSVEHMWVRRITEHSLVAHSIITTVLDDVALIEPTYKISVINACV